MPISTSIPKPATRSSSSQLAVDLPPRPSSAVAQPSQTPIQATPRSASAWDDLASLSNASSNASLPLQYMVNSTPAQPMAQQNLSFNPTNPYANLVATSGMQLQLSPFSQSLPQTPQQNPAMNIQTPGFNGGLQPSFGATPGFLPIPQPQSVNLPTLQAQQFNTGATIGTGMDGMNNLQQPFSAPAFPSQTFLPHQTQNFQTLQFQQPSGGIPSTTFQGQMQGLQQFTPSTSGNPFYAMQQQRLQQVQPMGYTSPQQQQFGVAASQTNPFSQMMQPRNPFSQAQTPGWQNGGFPSQQQQWG